MSGTRPAALRDPRAENDLRRDRVRQAPACRAGGQGWPHRDGRRGVPIRCHGWELPRRPVRRGVVRGLEAFQYAREQVGCEGGDDTDRDSKRTCVEALSNRLEYQRLVQYPERLFVRLPPQGGKKHTPRLSRSKSGAPRAASSSRIWSESAGWETYTPSAARLKEPCSTTA